MTNGTKIIRIPECTESIMVIWETVFTTPHLLSNEAVMAVHFHVDRLINPAVKTWIDA